ncbi:hypothetical protein [Chryseobacterium sp. Leaf201]|uniref:hypothetical protein n=1 Tax=Chryseobacterium sp. Leaf201 TaxID=1735672 RepID=UPI001EE709D2|nr:hypothetical protein [Chryseobacterium sp. Leaf201]
MRDKTKNTAQKALNVSQLQKQSKDLQNSVSDELLKLSDDDRSQRVSKIVQGSGCKGG